MQQGQKREKKSLESGRLDKPRLGEGLVRIPSSSCHIFFKGGKSGGKVGRLGEKAGKKRSNKNLHPALPSSSI